MRIILILLLCSLFEVAAEPPQGAALLKTDLMFVGAHPDDETGIAAVLARYAGQGKTVACVYATRGEGGGNMVGTQAGPSLGVLRERELRDCLEILGVRHVYFLDEEDFFYTESLSATLEKWGKEDVLGKLVRMVRALRPDVVITMNAAPNPGQHGHHQAAGILATEAFAAAADPQRFPEQLTREGLEPWQVRKLYYSSSAEPNVKVRTDEPLSDGTVPAELAGKALSQHRSQAFGNFSNSPWLRRPSSFVLARTAVDITLPENDLFQFLDRPVEVGAQRLLKALSPQAETVFEFVGRSSIQWFKRWARENEVEHTATTFLGDIPIPRPNDDTVRGTDIILIAPKNLPGPLELISTNTHWEFRRDTGRRVREIPGSELAEYPIRVVPLGSARGDVKLTARAGNLERTVNLHPIPVLEIPGKRSREGTGGVIQPEYLVQGKVDSEKDLYAGFVLTYDREDLVVVVQVTDDIVVSNIEPNDIKGHWRSDSVEICIDPNPGSEHTLNTFKLGIFPFDSTGQVRGARDADANQGPIERTAPEVRLSSERTRDGYVIQATIPWRYINAKPKRGTELGFNIIIYDGDKKDAAPGENINEARIAWSPRPGVQGRPEDWGRLILR
jgi:LmbE family N-acetylglucosaminyl deacetylase